MLHTCTTVYLLGLFPWQQVIEERNQLQLELSELQSERDRLFEEKVCGDMFGLAKSALPLLIDSLHFSTSSISSLSSTFPHSHIHHTSCVSSPSSSSLPPSLPPPSLPQVQLKGSLQELFSERRQLQQEVEGASNRCGRFETIARRLKEQNEVLCERVSRGGREGGRERKENREESGGRGGGRRALKEENELSAV